MMSTIISLNEVEGYLLGVKEHLIGYINNTTDVLKLDRDTRDKFRRIALSELEYCDDEDLVELIINRLEFLINMAIVAMKYIGNDDINFETDISNRYIGLVERSIDDILEDLNILIKLYN